jgi:hypothetical protein
MRRRKSAGRLRRAQPASTLPQKHAALPDRRAARDAVPVQRQAAYSGGNVSTTG